MPTIVIVPVKSFALGKQRLSGVLDPATRAALGRGLAEHVATTVVSVDLMPLIVTADADVAEWATLAGFPSVADPEQGLDVAADTGAAWARESGSNWIVLHSDLPLLSSSDISALEMPLDRSRPVIAPSSDGGTSAIGSSELVAFSFGISSFHRHLTMLDDPAIVATPGLLLDMDSPADLKAALSTPRGEWMRDLLPTSRAESILSP